MSDIKETQTIKEDAVISIDVSGSYYRRVNALLQYFTNSLDKETLTSVQKELQGDLDKLTLPESQHFLTIYSLLVTVSENAKDTDIKTTEITPEVVADLKSKLDV